MKIVFIGGCPPKHLQDRVRDWGSPTDYAGYAFQSALLSGLDELTTNLQVISLLWITTFPNSHRAYFKKEYFSHNNSKVKKDIFTGFINLPIIKRFSITWRTFIELKKLIHEEEEIIVIKYALSSANLLPIIWLRNRLKKTCLIIPDLPDFMSSNSNFMYRLGKVIDKRVLNYCIRHIDCFALLSPYMKDKLPLGNKPWIQIEGIYNPNDHVFSESILKEDKTVVFYSGALSLRYGIGDLVKAFHLIKDDNYELWLCGSGDALPFINNFIELDKRIHYLGILDRKVVLKKQVQATVLVNPRHKSELFTKYSFPSKTMEFLASGTPLIMSHLDSIPPEYDEHIFYFDDESPEGMSSKIVEICEKPREELRNFGKRASDFVLSQKSSYMQAKRLFEFVQH